MSAPTAPVFVPAAAPAVGSAVPVSVPASALAGAMCVLAPFIAHMGLVVGPLPVGSVRPDGPALLLFAPGAGGATTVGIAASRLSARFPVVVGVVEAVSASPWR